MRSIFIIFILLLLGNSNSYSKSIENGAVENMKTITIQIGNRNFKANLYDIPAANSLIEQFPLTINMNDLNRNEKYYNLNKNLPTNSKSVGEIKVGDIMLFGRNCLVLFYKSFSTFYDYTPLGYIEDIRELETTLGRGNVQVKFYVED